MTNAVTVQATVVADPAVVVRATLAGTVSKLLAADGAGVAAARRSWRSARRPRRTRSSPPTPETGEQTTTERKPKVDVATRQGPVAGTLTLPTLKDQVVSVGDEVGTIAPGTLSVSGTLTADQQYRLVGAPTQASVTLNGGPAPFDCTGLRIGAAADTGTDSDRRGPTAQPVDRHRHLRRPRRHHRVRRAGRHRRDHQRHGGRRRRRPGHRRCRAPCRRGTSGSSPPTGATRSARSALGLTDGEERADHRGPRGRRRGPAVHPGPGRRRARRSTAALDFDPRSCGG